MDSQKYCKYCNAYFSLNDTSHWQKAKSKSHKGEYTYQCKERKKQHYQDNKERIKEQYKHWYENNKEHMKQYRQDNKKRIKEQYKHWYENNKERIKEYTRKKIKTDPKFRLGRNFSTQVWMALKNKKAGQSWESLVGYTLNDLMLTLEALFKPGMTWDNYGEWHIDHITPKSWFQYESYEDPEFKKAWALDNLQPMWAEDNIRKGNRYAE